MPATNPADVFGRPNASDASEPDVLLATDCNPDKLARVRAMAKAQGWTITRVVYLGPDIDWSRPIEV